ncbi:hypothetical protein [Streptomyces kanasensis]|uniref:hypothetical protein n=1 Tax=Streptomyces kanasensis TaxID=936756 RepID=UPI0036F634E2
MTTTATSSPRPGRIVSGSGLPALLRESPDAIPFVPQTPDPCCVLTVDQLRGELLPRWREGVERQAKAMVRRSRGTLEVLTGETLYDRLDDPAHRRAALVAELFRNHQISANAGRLDSRALQRRVVEALAESEPLRFELAWGQAKRTVGGLKTHGQWADLAEVYAVGRVLALVLAARELAEDDRIGMTVYSGGNRFAKALYARPQAFAEYDAQRQRIAAALVGPGVAEFLDYAAVMRSDAAEDERHEERVARHLAALTDEDVAGQMPVMLFNVDWPQVLPLAAGGEAPHGVPMAPHVAEWLREAPDERVPLLVRAAVTCAVSPAAQARWLEVFGDRPEVLEDAIAFVLAVGRAAAARYTAIARADRDAPGRTAGPHTVRLTVHEKTDRPEVPAVLTLGVRGGAQLSQHVVARVSPDAPVTFASVAETQVRSPEAAPVLLADATAAPGTADEGTATPATTAAGADAAAADLFDWLVREDLPLCYASGPEQGVLRALAQVLDPDHG